MEDGLQFARNAISSLSISASSDDSSSPLCLVCSNLFSRRCPESEPGGPHTHSLGQTLGQLESTVPSCHLCRIRWSQLTRQELASLSTTADIKVGYWKHQVGNGIAFQYTCNSTAKKDNLQKSVAFVADQGYEQTTRFSQSRRRQLTNQGYHVDSQTFSQIHHTMNCDSSYQIISYWLNDCNINHSVCREVRSSMPWLPTRLVDLGSDTSNMHPVVCETRDLDASTPYATLSHCWGTENHLCLQTENFERLREGIPVDDLSKTFREAMEVTTRLGLRYIWIDSLCIIQNSDEDWKKEAALMEKVYHNGYCNIAATAAHNGSEGLFRDRKLIDVEPCRVKTAWFGRPLQKYFCVEIGSWDQEVQEQPLLSRAWVAQEITLGPRIVHYSQKRMFWECTQKRASETFPDNIPNFRAEKVSLRVPSPPLTAWLRVEDGNFPNHEIWTNVIKFYSQGDLTFAAKDKLIAASGLARSLDLPADEYLAGHWRSGLIDQLCWVTTDTNRKSDDKEIVVRPSRSTEYRAPSWSWASIDGAVIMRTPKLDSLNHSCVQILQASVDLVDQNNPFGQVRSGYIRLKGMLACARLTERIVVRSTTPAFRNGQLVHVQLPPSSREASITRYYLGDAHVNINLDGEELKINETYYCLPLSQRFGASGLIIAPGDKERGQYVRRGYFAILTGLDKSSSAKFLNQCRLFEAMAEDNQMLFEEKAGLEDDGIMRYIISLV